MFGLKDRVAVILALVLLSLMDQAEKDNVVSVFAQVRMVVQVRVKLKSVEKKME